MAMRSSKSSAAETGETRRNRDLEIGAGEKAQVAEARPETRRAESTIQESLALPRGLEPLFSP
jgi:hypothetical protein